MNESLHESQTVNVRLPHETPGPPSEAERGGVESAPSTEGHLAGQQTTAESVHEDRRNSDASAEPLSPRSSVTLIQAEVGSRGEDGLPQVAGYEMLSLLGRGAMGVVYKARQPGLNRLVALKMILSGEHAGEHDLTRFRVEAEAIARLQHPNIVQIHAVGEHQGRPFFSMEYVEGGTLADRLQGVPQPPDQAAALVRTLALAMAEAHRHHVIHRDLKPANVLLASGVRQPLGLEDATEQVPPSLADCVPKISDFGLAKRLDEDGGQTQTGAILGSPSYMACEQAEGKIKEVGPLSDVYALGAILYEMLTGRPPFRGATVLETLEQVRTREPVPPAQLQPSVPRDLETICLKCLHKDAARRYAGAGALADDLGRFLNGEPILARPVSGRERLARWCRRNPRLAAVSALSVALLLAWACTSSWLAWEISREKAATEQEHKEAVNNAVLARRNEKEAQASEKRATVARDNALRRHDQTVHAMIELGAVLQQQLQGQEITRELGPEAQALRERMFGTIKQAMLRLSQQMEGDQLTSFGLARAHQSMGDLLKRLGQGESALREYQHALDLIEQVVQKDADNDLARGNQALMVAMMAEKKLELTGNARAAYENFLRSSQIQQDIADHPRSGFYRERPPDNERLLANYDLQQGRASLLLADPVAARRSFEQAVRLRRQVAEAAKNTNKAVEAQGYLAEACYWLGQACSRQGDDKATRAAFNEAVDIGEGLVRRFPNSHDFKNDLADVYGAYGDAQICLGQPAEARRLYEKALPLVRLAFDKQADKLEYRALLARTHYRLGLVERDAAAARTHFQEVLRLREQLLRLDGQNVFYQADLASTLAHCGRNTDAARMADALRKRIENNPTLLLQLAGCYAQCSAAASAADRPAYVEKALQVARAAVTKDFQDRELLKTAADLEPIRPQPSYQEMLARLGER